MAKFHELILLRKTIKTYQPKVIKGIIDEYYNLNGGRVAFCMFCGTKSSLTKEHVLPRWTFEKCTKRNFITSVNGHRQTYNATTIPACTTCNGVLLNSLEKAVIKSLSEVNLEHTCFTDEVLQNIIRWLEIIDYKFQVIGFTRKFIKSETIPYNDYLSKIPLALYRTDLSSDKEIISELRHALKRVGIRSKF